MGCTVRYLIVLCEGQTPPQDDLSNIQRDAERTGRLLVLVAQEAGENVLAWSDFLLVMGGAVPMWRALGREYDTALLTLSQNQLPDGVVGEAWRLFEEAVGDGLEFLFGRRVRRLGGAARGSRVADLLAQTPDTRLLVVDSKASGDLFDASWPNLRPLVEYVKRQQTRQRGEIDVSAALVVAPSFKQDATALAGVAGQFLAETRVPAAFLTATTLVRMVQELRDRPRLRTAVNWANLFCQARLITADAFDAEITAVERERFHSDGAPGLASIRSNPTG